MNALPVRPGRVTGRPLHPPLTDFPIAAYVFAAAFDIISVIGHRHAWATELWHAGTFVLIGGVSICLLTVTAGFIDLLRPAEHRPEVSRAVTIHVCVMGTVFMVGAGDLAWRLSDYQNHASTPVGIAIVSVATAIGVCVGAAYGGKLVFGLAVGVQPASASLPPARAGVRPPESSSQRPGSGPGQMGNT